MLLLWRRYPHNARDYGAIERLGQFGLRNESKKKWKYFLLSFRNRVLICDLVWQKFWVPFRSLTPSFDPGRFPLCRWIFAWCLLFAAHNKKNGTAERRANEVQPQPTRKCWSLSRRQRRRLDEDWSCMQNKCSRSRFLCTDFGAMRWGRGRLDVLRPCGKAIVARRHQHSAIIYELRNPTRYTEAPWPDERPTEVRKWKWTGFWMMVIGGCSLVYCGMFG